MELSKKDTCVVTCTYVAGPNASTCILRGDTKTRVFAKRVMFKFCWFVQEGWPKKVNNENFTVDHFGRGSLSSMTASYGAMEFIYILKQGQQHQECRHWQEYMFGGLTWIRTLTS